jgi:hypothetical protein
MQQFKDLNACVAALQAIRAGSDITPEQKKFVGAAIEELKRLRRSHGASTTETYRRVRRIAENLTNAFLK